jgi:hypothetical protein
MFASPAFAQSAGDPDYLITGDCDYSHSNEGDPIVKPEEGMGHEHNFFCNTKTNQNSTANNMQSADTTSSRAQEKSAIWVPDITWGALEVKPDRTGAYWGTRTGLDPKKTRYIPYGYKMIAYSPDAEFRADGRPVGDRAHAKLDWHCDKTKNVQQSLTDGDATPPDYCASKTLGVTVTFPECWDGESWNVLGGANMRHSFVNALGDRVCPRDFPYYFPQLQLFVDYDLPTAAGPLMVKGHGIDLHSHERYHADYMNSEDMDALIQTCIREGRSATVDACRH